MSSPTRTDMLTALATLNLGTIGISQELPWINAGDPLYVKNPKRVYVDRHIRDEDSVILTLDNSVRAVNRTTTIRAYVAVDAKNQPSNFESVVDSIANLKNSSTFATQSQRECSITQQFDDDLLITEFEFQFAETVVN